MSGRPAPIHASPVAHTPAGAQWAGPIKPKGKKPGPGQFFGVAFTGNTKKGGRLSRKNRRKSSKSRKR